MRLYWTSGEKVGDELESMWSGTQADARADRKAMKEQGLDFIETKEVDVPTSKEALLVFLNKNDVVIK